MYAVDVDGDGDVDVLSASQNDDTIGWYENVDGAGASWTTHRIDEIPGADHAQTVFAIDMDLDGDIDVLSASYLDDTVAWYENMDGSGTSWGYYPISTTANGAWGVFAIDVDGDGDVDVLSASRWVGFGVRFWTGPVWTGYPGKRVFACLGSPAGPSQ